MSHIIQLTAENIKRLHAVDITPKGNVVEITGKNGQGKSSVIDAIAMALGGAGEIPTLPIHKGQKKARIVLDLGDLKVIRTFTEAGTSLIVETADGARFQSPQAILDKLTGKITFDPLGFIRLKRDEQAKVLRELVNLDFTQADYDRRQLYDQRTALNKAVAKVKALAEAMPVHPDAPAEEPSAADLIAELETANARNKAFNDEAFRIGSLGEDLGCNRVNRAEVDDEIKALHVRLSELATRQSDLDEEHRRIAFDIEDAKFKHASTDRVDVEPIRKRINDAGAVSLQVRANVARAAAFKAAESRHADSEALTAKIDALDAAKDAAIKGAAFPIEGLSFDETGVVFDGIPFDQVNTAVQLRVSVAIAAAMNPKLRVMLIRHGNDLDKDSFNLLGELAQLNGLQVWIERIEGGVGAVVIEDGSTKTEEAPKEAV